jgi:hypothetical protein
MKPIIRIPQQGRTDSELGAIPRCFRFEISSPRLARRWPGEPKSGTMFKGYGEADYPVAVTPAASAYAA